ncbi:MAG: hypothetical protein AAGA96_10575 [Verrucomicrobiota bacterium]
MTRSTVCTFIAATLILASNASGQSFTWTGGGSGNNWSTADNWEDGSVPSTNDSSQDITLVGGSSQGRTFINNLGTVTLDTLGTLGSMSSTGCLSGNDLVLNRFFGQHSGTLKLEVAVTLNGSANWSTNDPVIFGSLVDIGTRDLGILTSDDMTFEALSSSSRSLNSLVLTANARFASTDLVFNATEVSMVFGRVECEGSGNISFFHLNGSSTLANFSGINLRTSQSLTSNTFVNAQLGQIWGRGGNLHIGLSENDFGRIEVGDVLINNNTDVIFDIGSANNDVIVTSDNSVSFGGADLEINLRSVVGFGDEIMIIEKTSGGAFGATFQGLPEGAVFGATSDTFFQITYRGGTGSNDVILTRVSAPSDPRLTDITVEDDPSDPANFHRVTLIGTGSARNQRLSLHASANLADGFPERSQFTATNENFSTILQVSKTTKLEFYGVRPAP